jgi:hypothetical protein
MTLRVGTVQLIRALHDVVDRCPGELVAEDVEAHLAVRAREDADRLLDAFHRSRVAEGTPVAQALDEGWLRE